VVAPSSATASNPCKIKSAVVIGVPQHHANQVNSASVPNGAADPGR
jgi:hypothetical protein